MLFKHFYMSDSLPVYGFLLVFLDFFEVHRYFVDSRAKFYSNAVFFMERWSLSLQDPFFLVFFGFSMTYFNYICFYD